MSNITNGSITGFSGIVPAHLQAGGGANSASRALIQNSGNPATTAEYAPAFQQHFQSAVSTVNSGIDAVQMFKEECGEWFNSLFHWGPAYG